MPASERRLITGSERRLLTVLFTDIVGSTDLAVEMGDARWRELVARHHGLVRRALKRFGGREIDTAGDGFFATFDRPAQAIRCAADVVQAVRELGIEVRAGLHLGEVEVAAKNIGGVAVHTGARVLGAAGPGEVLVTATLRELVSGSGLGFADRGRHTLKGVPGTWLLYGLEAVDGHSLEPVQDPPTAAERRAAISAPTLFRRRKTPLVVGGATVLLVAVVLLIFFGTDPPPGGDGRPTAPPPLGSVVQFDPATRTIKLTTTPDVVVAHGGGNPKIAVGEGGIWVRSNSLVRIDSATGEVGRGGLLATTGDPRADRGVEVGSRAVWVGGDLGRGQALLFRWDPATNERLPDARIPSTLVANDIAVGGNNVWVSFGDGRLVKLDGRTLAVIGDTKAGEFADGVVVGAGGIWVLDVGNGTLTGIDPRTLERSGKATFGGSILAMAADPERVWLLDAVGDDVIPVGADGIVRDPIPVGPNPSGIAVGLEAVWVSDESGDVYRIDPLTKQADVFHVGGHLTAIAVDGTTDTLWLTVGGD
jgi:class 3 adenylate cyclase/streptogramin lyase